MPTNISVEEEMEMLASYFSEEAIDSLTNHLPQETLDELLQVIRRVADRERRFRDRIKELEAVRLQTR